MDKLGLEILGEAPDVLTGVIAMEELAPRQTGPLKISFVGVIEDAHLMDLQVARPIAPLLKDMQARYHEIARYVAVGLPPMEIARRLKLSPATLTIVTETPAFKMVLAQHMKTRDESFASLQKQINLVAEDALAEIHTRVISGEISDKELVRITTDLLGMDGYGTVQKHLVLTANSDEVLRAKRAALEANKDRVFRVDTNGDAARRVGGAKLESLPQPTSEGG